MGKNAGYNSVSTGITGDYNIGLGTDTGKALTTGADNIFLGRQSGQILTTGTKNVFIGYQAGANINGAHSGNIFIGNQAGYNGSGSYESIALGTSSVTSGTYQISLGFTSYPGSGTANIALGAYSGAGSGNYNLALGYGAGNYGNVTGLGNIFMGYGAGNNTTSGAKNITIGYDVDTPVATGTGQLTIGNLLFGTGLDGTATTVSTGKIGIGVATPSYRFSVSDTTTAGIVGSFTNSDGTCTLDPGDVSGWSCPSDINLKKDIETLTSGSLDQILALRPVNYRLRNESNSTDLSTGLIAQEVQTIFPKLVKTQMDGTLSLNYGGLTPYMIKAIQEMNLNVTEIGLVEKPNSWRDALIAWFGNAANGITEFFSKKVSTEELCVTDSAGQTCITRTQLDALLNGQGIPTPAPSPTPDPTPSDNPVECTAPQVLNSDGTGCETPSSGDPTPEPTPEPDPVPPPADNSDPGPTE
jgi:hypothetical protein